MVSEVRAFGASAPHQRMEHGSNGWFRELLCHVERDANAARGIGAKHERLLTLASPNLFPTPSFILAMNRPT